MEAGCMLWYWVQSLPEAPHGEPAGLAGQVGGTACPQKWKWHQISKRTVKPNWTRRWQITCPPAAKFSCWATGQAVTGHKRDITAENRGTRAAQTWGWSASFPLHKAFFLPWTEKPFQKRGRRKSEIPNDYPKGTVTHVCQIELIFCPCGRHFLRWLLMISLPSFWLVYIIHSPLSKVLT